MPGTILVLIVPTMREFSCKILSVVQMASESSRLNLFRCPDMSYNIIGRPLSNSKGVILDLEAQPRKNSYLQFFCMNRLY